MIFVTVGSRKYPFDRLFIRLDDLCEKGLINEPIFAQIGTSQYQPKHFEWVDFLSTTDFDERIAQADIVISHGASGSIMNALKKNKKVIVVTRLAKYNEHIDDHQIQNNQAFSINHYVLMADLELGDLSDCIREIRSGNPPLRPWENKDPYSIHRLIEAFIEEHW